MENGRNDGQENLVRMLLSRGGLVIGVLLLILGAILHGFHESPTLQVCAALCVEIGAVILAFALLHMTYERYTRETWNNAIREQIKSAVDEIVSFSTAGMKRAYVALSDAELGSMLRSGKHIRVLKTWFPEADDLAACFRVALQNAAQIDILLCHPDAAILAQRSVSAGETENEGRRWVERALRIFLDECTNGCNTKFKIGLYDSWPGAPIIWIDGRILLGFYFRGHKSPSTTWIEVWPGSGLAAILAEQFESLWKNGSTKVIENHAELAKFMADRRISSQTK